ncbi:MAG: aminotransferase class I/II-fold pyridoxal phosphate-dependent enzyme [Paludibacteraceae bacterium]|nr:aminotransferase class I/II-fold pyridoxal phosphate-dependent enzyme [Paludibacteraceae bacterium]
MERKTIYLCLAHMSEEGLEQKYIKEAFDTNWVVPLGPNVNAFEEDLRKFVIGNTESEILSQSRWPEAWESAWHLKENLKNKQVVALSAGTAAVHLALIACGVKAGDEVCVQSFTFCASSHPITYLGATPVFIDSERETWNMDPDLLEKAIIDRKEKTGKYPKAIIPVALYGMPYNCDRIMEIANKYDIPVIEDAAEGFGSKYKGQVLGTFGKFGVLSFNGNKMITTSGGGALICNDAESKNNVMWYATQARDAYPYYQHTAIGYNYRMSNICAGIGRGQMTVAQAHINHHKHVQSLYKELLKDVKGVKLNEAPNADYDSNYWLCTITLDPNLKVKGQEKAYKEVIKTAVGGAAGVIHAVEDPTTDCQPNENVEALRVFMLEKKVEARPVWKPMHKQPVYANAPAYVNGVSESIFKVGMCLPAGPYVTDDDVKYIVDCIKEAIAG